MPDLRRLTHRRGGRVVTAEIPGLEVSAGAFARTALKTQPFDMAQALDHWTGEMTGVRAEIACWLRAVAEELDSIDPRLASLDANMTAG